MKFKYLAFVVISSFSAIISCSSDGSFREVWEAKHITDYTIDEEILCFCYFGEGVYKIEVRSDTVFSAVIKSSGLPSSVDANQFFTIHELFDLIDSANAGHADQIAVQYDPTYHYPKSIAIDYFKDLVDDELTVKVSNLHY